MSEETTQKPPRSRVLIAILPLVIFLAFAGLFYSLLTPDRDPSKLPSALLDKPAPILELPPVDGLINENLQVPGVSKSVFEGKVSVVNFFASWCVPCRQEHPQMLALAKDERIQMIGINYKDNRRNAVAFLEELENPYDIVGRDRQGRAGIEWGVYGIPETFFVDGKGVIFYKHIGPITPEILSNEILPILEQKL